MQTKTISIIGLGRTGLSIALALREAPLQFTLVGHDSDRRRAQAAQQEQGAIDKAERNLVDAAAAGDIVVLAVPDAELRGTLQAIGSALQPHALVIDLSVLKGPGNKWAKQYLPAGHYIGARPVFAAATFEDGRTTAEEAHAELFQNSIFCVMPAADTDPKAVETAVNFGRLLGAQPYFVDPLEYDGLVQGVETLPGLVAAALFSAVHKSTGWRDILRFADLRFALMTQPLAEDAADIAHLASNNRLSVLHWLDALAAEIQLLRQRVADDEEEALAALLRDLGDERARWLHERSKNDWVEVTRPDMSSISWSQQMFGALAQPRRKKDES